jgi:hypothetical protein
MKTIAIDLDVNRAIEGARTSFDEDQNAILRRLLRIDASPPVARGQPRMRLPRSSGAYSTRIGTVPVEANSLKELLRRIILVCARGKPRFLNELAAVSTRRGRRIIARSPAAIYPNVPQLVEFAEHLNSGWWFDTNVGRAQVTSYLRIIARLARLPHLPVIAKRTEKTTQTLEDLGI